MRAIHGANACIPSWRAYTCHMPAGTSPTSCPSPIQEFWSLDTGDIAQRLLTSPSGLSGAEAAGRLVQYGPNELRRQRGLSRARVLWNQLRSPLLLLLIVAALASGFAGEWVDAAIVLAIIVASVGIGYSREYRAQSAAAQLQARMVTRATVLRDGKSTVIPSREVVVGDIILLSAGSLIPADARLVEAADCFVNEAVLTGESYPVEKKPGRVLPTATLAERSNCLFLGTSVRSGTARCIVVQTGPATEFGAIARHLTLRPPEAEFERGIRHFGYLLASAMFVMVLLVFAANMYLQRPLIDTLLFAIALAVGLSPELLPAILNINLARGARMMARRGVLVRRLSAIENLGSMNILCTDKTGTLTEGVIQLEGAYGSAGEPSSAVLGLGAINAALQTGLANPLDEAILKAQRPDPGLTPKLGEIPYDFVRKRLSVIVRETAGPRLIAKGAFEQILAICARNADGALLDDSGRAALRAHYDRWGSQGIRVLAVATRAMPEQAGYSRNDETGLDFAGFLTFLDRPKEGVANALEDLRKLGVAVKLITGDSRLVAQHLAAKVGLHATHVLTGKDLDELHDEALWRTAQDTDLFVEVDPNQKERIILALKKAGHVVGFLGDGINDAPAMHAADTSLSVEHAVDIAREAADFVLLERDLDVIRGGIEEGRRTFANTLKYILTTTSANLGNMVSMAVASLFLPFLPLLAGQILLNNFLSDIPAVGVADDSVDHELVERPQRWSMAFIGRFMLTFGLLSSLFDLLTFGVLLGLFAAGVELFRTGWFVESLLTELVVALVVRTRRPFYRSRPGNLLLVSTIAVAALAVVIPYFPLSRLLGFVAIPPTMLLVLVGITALYVLATELLKARFYRGQR
jgi:Mg2+-importing ATPase